MKNVQKYIYNAFFLIFLFGLASTPIEAAEAVPFWAPPYPDAEYTYIQNVSQDKGETKLRYQIISGYRAREAADFYKDWARQQGLPLVSDEKSMNDYAPGYILNFELKKGSISQTVRIETSEASDSRFEYFLSPSDGGMGGGMIRKDEPNTLEIPSNAVFYTGKTKIYISYHSNIPVTPMPTPLSGMCTLPSDIEQKRQEIMADIAKRYKFKIVDSNMCEKTDCLANPKWTVEDLTQIRNLLDSLPRCFVDNLNLDQIAGRLQGVAQGDILKTSSEKSLEQLCCDPEMLKHCYWGGTLPLGYNTIMFCGDRFRNTTDLCSKGSSALGGVTLGTILLHEMTHAYQNKGIYFPWDAYNTLSMQEWMLVTKWVCVPVIGCKNFQESEFPTDYAATNPLEDMAESVRLYYSDPAKLKSISPSRYDFIKKYIMCGKEFGVK